jgi:superfamily II DNA helicase RecQ
VTELGTLLSSKFFQHTLSFRTTKHPSTHNSPAPVQCGIVYCLSRADCEKMADDLDAALRGVLGPAPRGARRVK